jgi:hypothetical protein
MALAAIDRQVAATLELGLSRVQPVSTMQLRIALEAGSIANSFLAIGTAPGFCTPDPA